MSILIPTVGLMMVRARQTKSSANLSSIGKALSLYTLDNYGLLPAPTFGTSTAPASSPAVRIRRGSWLEELVGQKYLGGTFTTNLGSSTGTVDDWPSVLTCPQYVSEHSVISDPDVRGYGMNIFPYRRTKTAPISRSPTHPAPEAGKPAQSWQQHRHRHQQRRDDGAGRGRNL